MAGRENDSRFYPSREDTRETKTLEKEALSRNRRRRRIEREVFDTATWDLDRPLLRPRTGAPLRPSADIPEPPDPHCPNMSVALPPANFTEEEMEYF